jgi:hypothetical protein
MGVWEIADSGRQVLDEDVVRLRLRTVRGDVSVVGGDGPARVEVSGVKGKPVKIRHEAGLLDVGYDDWRLPKGPIGWWFKVGIWRRRATVTVKVPKDCPVDLHVASGSLVVSGLRGRVDARVVSGAVTLAALSGPVDAETISGSIDAESISGDLRLHAVSGELTVVEASGRAVYADTTSGSITCDVVGDADDVRLSTVSGEIVVRVPAHSDLAYRLQATSGHITSAFDPTARRNTPGNSLTEGAIGAGVGRLAAKTVSGHISLLRRTDSDEVDG